MGLLPPPSLPALPSAASAELSSTAPAGSAAAGFSLPPGLQDLINKAIKNAVAKSVGEAMANHRAKEEPAKEEPAKPEAVNNTDRNSQQGNSGRPMIGNTYMVFGNGGGQTPMVIPAPAPLAPVEPVQAAPCVT